MATGPASLGAALQIQENGKGRNTSYKQALDAPRAGLRTLVCTGGVSEAPLGVTRWVGGFLCFYPNSGDKRGRKQNRRCEKCGWGLMQEE